MFVHRRFNASSMRMIHAVIFIFYICNVRSQSSTESPTDITSDMFTDDTSSTATIESTIITTDSNNTLITITADTNQTTEFSNTTSTSINTATSSGSNPTAPTVSTSSTSSATTIVTACPPGKFPFLNDCIDAATNGGVVITAFILSIISFIGVIGAASYLLFFRKYFSPKKNHTVTNYNVPEQKIIRTSTKTDNKSSTLSAPKNQRRNSQGTIIKKNLNPNHTSKDTTIITDSRPGQKTNVLDKQPAVNHPKIKQRKQEHHSIHIDDSQF